MRTRPPHLIAIEHSHRWKRAAAFALIALSACQPMGEAASLAERSTSEAGQELSPALASNGRVAYHRLTAPGNSDIYLVAEGGAPLNLTADSPANDTEPAFSPDGQSIAFRSAREGGGIFVMSASGGAARRVVQGAGFNPSWSPDGTQILYSLISAAASPYGAAVAPTGLWVVSAQGGQPRQITPAYGFEPQMSPDGGRVAYWAVGDGTGGVERDIWTVRTDGSDALRVTDDEAVDWSPVWSADGRQLYFASDREGAMKIWRVAIDQSSGIASGPPELVSHDQGAQVRGHLSLSAEGQLAYMDATIARTLHRVAIDPATGAAQGEAVHIPEPSLHPTGDFAPSPDGQWIAFRTGERQEDLYVMRPDGTGLEQLTNDPYRDRTLYWTPDGRIIFRSDRPVEGDRVYRWYEINPDGTGMAMLGIGGPAAPRWSPDGTKVSIVRNVAGGGQELVVTNPDGSDLRVVATTPGLFAAPVWSPDGRRIASRDTRGADVSAFVLDVTRPGTTPEALPAMNFLPTEWAPDGSALAGDRVFGDRPALTMVFDLRTKQFEQLTEIGAGAQWLANGRQLLIVKDANTIQLVDRATKAVRDLVSLRPPNTLVFALSADNGSLYYLEFELQGDVYQMTVP